MIYTKEMKFDMSIFTGTAAAAKHNDYRTAADIDFHRTPASMTTANFVVWDPGSPERC